MSIQAPSIQLPVGDQEPASRMWTWKDAALISAVILAGMAAGLILWSLIALPAARGTPGGLTEVYTLGTIVIEVVVMVGAVWALGLRRRQISWAAFGLRPISFKWVLGALGLFVLMRIVVTVIAALQQAIGLTSQQATALAPQGFTWLSVIGSLVLTGVAGPIAEELFFRGVLYRWLRERRGLAMGLILSSAIFGLFHIEPATMLPAAVIGLVCAFAYERSHSLLPPIIIHIANNVFAVVVLYLYLAAGGTLNAGQ